MSAVLEQGPIITPQWEKGFPIIEEKAIRKFAKSIGDMNPLHHSNEAAQKIGLHGIIAPAVMTFGLISSTLADKLPNAQICRLEIDFVKPLYAGSFPVVLCSVASHIKRFVKVTISVKNGSETIAFGSCLLALPRT